MMKRCESALEKQAPDANQTIKVSAARLTQRKCYSGCPDLNNVSDLWAGAAHHSHD